MWISTDPALGEYIPKAPINEEAKRYNQNLPGMGGIFNHINGNLYHYASNNPVRYIDPTGRADADTFYKVAKELFEKAPNVAVADSPAPGPCDIVALGILVTAVSALAVGGCIDLYNYATSKVNSDSATKAEEKNQNQSQTILYRAVSAKELESIKQLGGRFSMGNESTYELGKLFQTSLADTYNYAKLANEKIAKDDPYVSIVVTRAPKEAYIHVDSIIDAPSAVIVLKENLPLLTPALPLPLGK